MKKIHLRGKLNLSKVTVSKLNAKLLNHVKGGANLKPSRDCTKPSGCSACTSPTMKTR